MKNIALKFILFCTVIVFSGCTLDEIENPNAPTVGSFEEGASQADIQLLAVGLQAVMRNDLAFHYNTMSILAREYYDLSQIDPRYTGELLKGPLDNNGFLTTRAFAAWYKVVKSANVLNVAVENSQAGFSDAVKNSYYGFANTLKAYSLLMVANRQFDNGIRLEVADPDNLGPNVGYSEALAGIMDLLNTGLSQLNSSSATFDSPVGFNGFDTPAAFAQFNRAIAARVALYQGNDQLALSMLNNSFFDLNGGLFNGPAHSFGANGNNILNTQFHVLNATEGAFMIQDSWFADAEANDSRVTSKSNRYLDSDGVPTTVSFDGLSGDYQIAIYDSNTSPVYLIRNEELILIYAEAQINSNPGQAVAAINVVRNAAGIGNYTGTQDPTALLNEILKQRRYSLIAEGHRLIDLRRTGRLSEIQLDRADDNIISQFPTPFNEGL